MSRPHYLWCYGRVSDPKQLKGDGQRRQEDREWKAAAAEHGLTVHPKFIFDGGLSAWSAENMGPKGQLGIFLAKAERSVEVRPGDCLGCECWDRLSKQDDKHTLNFFMRLVNVGIHLLDVKRKKFIHADKFDLMDLVDLLMTTGRGHEGSSTTSDRCLQTLAERRKKAAKGELIHVTHLPSWIREVPCSKDHPEARLMGSLKKPRVVRLELKDPQASIMREILRLAKAGMKGERIVKEMIRRDIASPGGKNWNADYVNGLLHDRRLVGDARHVPSSKSKNQTGATDVVWIPGVFPKVCEEGELLALAPTRGRVASGRGRDTALPNPFQGLVSDALTGSPCYLHQEKMGEKLWRHVWRTTESKAGRGKSTGFPYEAFEECICKKLREINPATILGENTETSDISELSGRHRKAKQDVENFQADLEKNGYLPELAEQLRKAVARRDELAAALAVAIHRQSHPLAESWGEQRTLLEAMQSADDPEAVRLALRARLKETVERIWILIVPRPKERIAAVQFDFKGGKTITRRHYLIRYWRAVRTASYSRPAGWEVVSWRSEGEWRGIDLASREESQALASVLASEMSVAKLAASHKARK